ncbi:MAG: hypothetical protein ACTSVO_09765 [Candidatus Heimdallarchaeaceae archaeon]
MTNQSEEKPKKRYGFKIILFLFGIIEIGLIVTAITFIVSATADFPLDFDKMITGYILIAAFGGLLVIFFPILIISFVMSKRKELTKTFHNISSSVSSASAAALAPYTASYRPSKSGKVYYCDYCGYEVKSHERECPECGGPIKRGTRVA